MQRMQILLMAAASMLLAGGAAAQSTPQSAPDNMSGPSMSPAPATAAGSDASAQLGTPNHPIPQNSPTPPDEAYKLKAGDPNVVSNAPVPDTPQSRAAFGQPLSNAGKRTAASGD